VFIYISLLHNNQSFSIKHLKTDIKGSNISYEKNNAINKTLYMLITANPIRELITIIKSGNINKPA